MKNILTYLKQWALTNWLAIVIGVLLGFGAGAVMAGTATVSWAHPTQNTDGSALPQSQITATRIEWGICSGAAFGTKAGEVVVSGTGTSTVVNNLAAGNTCFRGFTRANGNEGVASNVVAHVIPSPIPGAPTLTTVSAVAYDVRWSWKDRSFVLNREVGRIALGTACSGDFTLDGGYARVDRKAVKLSRRAKSPVIVAKCA